MKTKAIFYDPERKRWRRLRLVLNTLGVLCTLLMAFFLVSVLRRAALPSLALPDERPAYRAVKEKKPKRVSPHRKKPETKASEITLNTGEPIRAAFYVTWDAGSYSALSMYGHQIDLLFPEYLHVFTPDGTVQAPGEGNVMFNVVENGHVRIVDPAEGKPQSRVMALIKQEKLPTEVFPLINNYNSRTNKWEDVSALFADPAARARLRQQVVAFLASDSYRGLMVDFEEFPTSAQPGYKVLLAELAADLHARGLKLYVSTPVASPEWDYKFIAAQADGVMLMNYDQHYLGGLPGPVAGQDWFTDNLRKALKVIPREKIICGIGNYGSDWPDRKKSKAEATNVTVQEAWLHAHESDANIEFDPDSLTPHYSYDDENGVLHDVWFTDAVTALNQMRAARDLGIGTFALWRLGSEDRSLWNIWDRPRDPDAAKKLAAVPPGYDVDLESRGEVLRVADVPHPGERTAGEDAQRKLITSESYQSVPTPYVLDHYGARPRQVAITFDDGPDPEWTPPILDVLKRQNVKATFFLIGAQAEKYPGLMKRIYAEGHEIGNHTWTHPNISAISHAHLQLELNLTERLFEAELGVKPLYFRPPYSTDEEPDTNDEVRPLEEVQQMGYISTASNNDPGDWRQDPRRSAEQLAASVLDPNHLPVCASDAVARQGCGNIILLHDGGGDRRETLRALPLIIEGLRARGYEIVPVSTLIGKTRAEMMPPIAANERWSARLDLIGFRAMGAFNKSVVIIFFVGDALMTLRLFIIGAFAIFDRFRRRAAYAMANGHAAGYQPSVAILIPAYNEEKVIVRTVRAALDSEYPASKLRVIVIDDGSRDHTLNVARAAFAAQIEQGSVVVLTKPNSGKADALNFALQQVTEDVYVGIDADTVIARSAVAWLVPHFSDPRVAAVAGNAKVGNRVNIWTRWQALEYITSQNFERRALNTLNAVSVIPGAIGAWRTSLVRDAGGYHHDTVAEDADLSMSLLQSGHRLQYEDRALAYTEAPVTAGALIRQRFRWSFGIVQALWKHRSVFARKGLLGLVALPNILVFQVILPLVSPFIDIMFLLGALNYAIDRRFHPDTADSSSFDRLLLFFLAFLIIDFITSAIAFALERRSADSDEDLWLLGDIWIQRFTYRQLFSVVLFKTVKRVLDGRSFQWDKLERTARLTYADRPRPETAKS
jgi:cellulose synthase/poly-beta-1,6-N-acetylglucosamine synthase-like glycosyltransferase/peptidoglycan/xylan/chitin deacetylase (PgdA/CDA1 family)